MFSGSMLSVRVMMSGGLVKNWRCVSYLSDSEWMFVW